METDWADVLARSDGYLLQPPAEPDSITAAETALDVALPPTLRALYLVTDGVQDGPGQWFVIWTLADLVERNQTAYVLEGTRRRELVGFGDDGTGAPFCANLDGSDDIYHWSPIDQAATRLAADLEAFWSGWTSGALHT